MYPMQQSECIFCASDHATGLSGRRWLVRTGSQATHRHLHTSTKISLKHFPSGLFQLILNGREQLHEVMVERLCCKYMNFRLRYIVQEPVTWSSRAQHKFALCALHIGSISPPCESLGACCPHPPSYHTLSSMNFSAAGLSPW